MNIDTNIVFVTSFMYIFLHTYIHTCKEDFSVVLCEEETTFTHLGGAGDGNWANRNLRSGSVRRKEALKKTKGKKKRLTNVDGPHLLHVGLPTFGNSLNARSPTSHPPSPARPTVTSWLLPHGLQELLLRRVFNFSAIVATALTPRRIVLRAAQTQWGCFVTCGGAVLWGQKPLQALAAAQVDEYRAQCAFPKQFNPIIKPQSPRARHTSTSERAQTNRHTKKGRRQ